ncbi:ankyrin repeats (3 copies) domain-containing protein [Ditylenchus destructor]|uniref:Ankyrin repeats (3 copies) domain-containing protein n=1 Tax=Ditylenchus destructor TaxID=166010 RepID=A0AAD4MIE7_9BILA|nr:ankyrin repeats (3 copies) domain-containing protein [Ditylenchus destructor]
MIVYVCLWVISISIVSSAPAKKEDSLDLIKALNDGKFEHALSLAKEGTGINAKNENGLTPLLLALNMIIEVKGVLPNLINAMNDRNYDLALFYDWTPLLEAARYGKTKMAKMFMAKGADVLAKTKSGEGVLNWAANSGDNELVKIFLARGADPTLMDLFTPLMRAANRNYEEVVKTLLQDKRVRDTINVSNGSYTALGFAQRDHDTNIVKILKENGARG